MENLTTEQTKQNDSDYPSRLEPTGTGSYWYRPLSKDAIIIGASIILGVLALIAFGYSITLIAGVVAVFSFGLLMLIKQPHGVYGDEISRHAHPPVLLERDKPELNEHDEHHAF